MLNTASNTKRKERSGTDGRHLAELRERTAVVKSDIRELANAAGEAALSTMDPLEAYVRDKPLKSILIAAGIGAAVGFLFRR
jgi:ElaB/YqjD/DUF883 family membrane-anchored ribosome-binding protein